MQLSVVICGTIQLHYAFFTLQTCVVVRNKLKIQLHHS